MKQPLVLELKGNSLDDGPGIRSVIFVKGCPLSCVWCHNPESKNTAMEISFSRRDCIGCGICLHTCQHNALSPDYEHYIDRNRCNLCFECVEACPAKALTRVGVELSSDEILDIVLRDKPFFDVSGGGVTLSGGEITMFPEFAGELLRKLKQHGIHTLIETCGHFQFDVFSQMILPFVDHIYYDIKLFDSQLHKKYCGLGNEKILDHFPKLYAMSQDGSFTILPRIPLIPNITDTDENLVAIADFLSGLKVRTVQLLPYNPTWTEKNQKLGMNTPADIEKEQGWQSKEKLLRCEGVFLERGIDIT